jgi:predicted ATP-grasp superfamily ATP-dependent carboligase
LCNADYYGTLAATRVLGRAGIPVTVASDSVMGVARWSRYATRTVTCPSTLHPSFTDWLAKFCAQHPGHVLYPTSDDTTYLFARHRERLSAHAKLALPSLASIMNVLDKKKLYLAAHAAGLRTPETRFPEQDSEVEPLAAEISGSILLKARCQILYRNRSKGELSRGSATLLEQYRGFDRSNEYGADLVEHYPEATRPMLQRYHAESADRIYSLAGYINPSGDLVAARGSYKVLQRPRKLGVGLCFESGPVDPLLLSGVRRLCALTGYHGLFQIEFVCVGDDRLLIDFNPRFYNQLAFDVARGLELPLIVYNEALVNEAEIAGLVRRSDGGSSASAKVFCNRLGFNLVVTLQRLSGRMPVAEAEAWHTWYRKHRGNVVDSTADGEDPIPLLADLALQIHDCVRHPRSFVRKVVLNS